MWVCVCVLPQSDLPQERKPRAVRPAGRLCTELHRHLTTAQDSEDTPAQDTEEDEEEEEDEDSESEEDEEEEGEVALKAHARLLLRYVRHTSLF